MNEKELEYKKIYETAYNYMNEDVIEGNCGELCNALCCSETKEGQEPMGIYFLPFEYEVMQKQNDTIDHENLEYHTSDEYLFTDEVEFLIYGFCKGLDKCIRTLRPIQCRTFPLIPQYINGKLCLIVEKEQAYQCPLLGKRESWRKEYIEGIYKGWKELIKIPEVLAIIKDDSEVREIEGNIDQYYYFNDK